MQSVSVLIEVHRRMSRKSLSAASRCRLAAPPWPLSRPDEKEFLLVFLRAISLPRTYASNDEALLFDTVAKRHGEKFANTSTASKAIGEDINDRSI